MKNVENAILQSYHPSNSPSPSSDCYCERVCYSKIKDIPGDETYVDRLQFEAARSFELENALGIILLAGRD